MKFKQILSIVTIIFMLAFSFFVVRELLRPELLPVGAHLDTLTLETHNGIEYYDLKKEKPTIVFILSQTCEHCLYQFESLKENVEKYQDYDLLVLFMDNSDKTLELAELSIYPNISVERVNEKSIQRIFGKGGIPRFFLIDKNGYLRRKIMGEVKQEYLLNEIESLFVRTQR